jgi:uncharacterized protein (TIGR02594 family)
MEQPAWLEQAWREAGVREVPGPASNERILAFFREVGHAQVRDDEVAWCAAFLGACLERAGHRSTRSLLARSYLEWGIPLDIPRLGAIAVLSRGSDPGQGHVGFVVGCDGDRFFLLGGNQQDSVTVQAFERARLIGLRWPSVTDTSKSAGDGLFEAALAHVLEMEGGWSNDPYDPGGPTNRGITLAVYAAAKGKELTDSNRDALVAELRRLDLATTKRIYAERYWKPSSAAALPPSVAIMHFDAAVNHGVGNAARMLQEAVRVMIDGEIGPQTLNAVTAMPQAELISRYADIRRARYRSLPHFWRFGQGWLNRVDRTLAAAQRIGRGKPLHQQPGTGATDMPSDTSAGTSKWWAHSMTIWGAFITAASTVLPVLGPIIGIDITGDLVRQLGDQVVQVAQAIGGLVGLAMTIYGRTRATRTLERRPITFQF